jgi:TPR repeat protein
MRRSPRLLLLLPCLCLVPATLSAAQKEKTPADALPQLISTQTGAPKWKDTKGLKAHAAKGDPQACFELGTRLLEGDDEVAADLAVARTLLETAATGGVADAQFRLGKIYHDARGVPRDYAKALEYYTAAARRGVPEAQHNIGSMLVSARGVKRDFVEGLAWLLVAEKSGAVSQAVVQVRERLAKKTSDIRAAEARAAELLADLPHAVVRTGAQALPAITAPTENAPVRIETKPVAVPILTAPKIEPLAPPVITPPPATPPVAPR